MAEPEALDAHETLKPTEPHFTLQGGDPLGAPLVRLWAQLARLRAGINTNTVLAGALDDVIAAAEENLEPVERERDELKKRATLAEQASWKMDDYLKGRAGAEEAEIPDEKLTVDERLDLHDLRLFAAGRLSNMYSELEGIAERLEKAKFDGLDNLWPVKIKVIIANLRDLHDIIEPASHRERYAGPNTPAGRARRAKEG